jgi:hypothetical protein
LFAGLRGPQAAGTATDLSFCKTPNISTLSFSMQTAVMGSDLFSARVRDALGVRHFERGAVGAGAGAARATGWNLRETGASKPELTKACLPCLPMNALTPKNKLTCGMCWLSGILRKLSLALGLKSCRVRCCLCIKLAELGGMFRRERRLAGAQCTCSHCWFSQARDSGPYYTLFCATLTTLRRDTEMNAPAPPLGLCSLVISFPCTRDLPRHKHFCRHWDSTKTGPGPLQAELAGPVLHCWHCI